MFRFIVLVAFIGLTLAATNPIDSGAQSQTYVNQLKQEGIYNYQFDTTNGISVQESGVGGYYATGSSSYYSPEGKLIQLQFTADENGYHPEGDHLPTSPPIPDYILRALEYIRTHPQPEKQIQNQNFLKKVR